MVPFIDHIQSLGWIVATGYKGGEIMIVEMGRKLLCNVFKDNSFRKLLDILPIFFSS